MFRKVVIPAVLGDDSKDSEVAPCNGAYANALVEYESNGAMYIYASDGIYTKLEGSYTEIQKDIEKAISEEEEARTRADENLQNQIDNIPHNLPIASKTTLGGIKVGDNLTITADGTLSSTGGGGGGTWGSITGNISDQTDLKNALDRKADTSSLNAESVARGNADANLQSQINTKAEISALTAETTNRENSDTALQSQIDAITSKTDIVDIVGTKQALDEYITTDLGDNDIIKVLMDETHNNSPSYYRWHKTAGTWSYVGSESVSFTKAEAEALFVPKTRTINNKALSANVTLTTSDLANDSGYLTEGDLTNYVKNTDYADTTTGGVIKVNSAYGIKVSSGNLASMSRSYDQYVTADNSMFIGKATLENVIAGKGLATITIREW